MIWRKLKIHLSQDEDLLENIESVQNFINEIQDIAYNDQKYKEFKSKNNIFKTNTTSADYFEIARRAYFQQYAKSEASGIKVDEQITTITVEAGTIDDFFVNVKSKGTYSSSTETETNGLNVYYRIMKASTGYLVGNYSAIIKCDLGLVPLNPMITKDVSNDLIYHYTK